MATSNMKPLHRRRHMLRDASEAAQLQKLEQLKKVQFMLIQDGEVQMPSTSAAASTEQVGLSTALSSERLGVGPTQTLIKASSSLAVVAERSEYVANSASNRRIERLTSPRGPSRSRSAFASPRSLD